MESKKKIELGWSYPRRKKYLGELSMIATGKTQNEYFQNSNQDFTVHVIPIEVAKYRIDNGRTFAAQAQYIASNKLDPDFFSKDAESDAVQQAQHEILKGMTKEKGLLEYFKTHEQGDAIILSQEGYVINGNRRLCAWRELLSTGEYPKFSHVRAIILPVADQKDIDELEARKQVHQDIKADYTWTARALMLRHRKSTYNYTEEQLAELFEMSEGEIEELMDMLSYAETYLDERAKIGQYKLVDKAEFAFRQLHKKRSRIKEESYKDVFEQLAFCLIDRSEEGRLYQSIPDLADNLGKVVDDLKVEFKVNDQAVAGKPTLLGGTSYSSIGGVLDVIQDPGNQMKVSTVVLNTIEAEKEKSKEKKERDYVLLQIKKANTALIDALSAIDEKTNWDGVPQHLQSIDKSLLGIKEKFKQ